MNDASILFVDDQPVILAALKKDFRDEPYEKHFASSCKEALEILEKEQIHVIVTDLSMPGESGHDLLKIVMENYHLIVRIVLSGQTDVNTILAAVNEGRAFKYISKPWKLEEEFKPAIRNALEYYQVKVNRSVKQMVAAE